MEVRKAPVRAASQRRLGHGFGPRAGRGADADGAHLLWMGVTAGSGFPLVGRWKAGRSSPLVAACRQADDTRRMKCDNSRPSSATSRPGHIPPKCLAFVMPMPPIGRHAMPNSDHCPQFGRIATMDLSWPAISDWCRRFGAAFQPIQTRRPKACSRRSIARAHRRNAPSPRRTSIPINSCAVCRIPCRTAGYACVRSEVAPPVDLIPFDPLSRHIATTQSGHFGAGRTQQSGHGHCQFRKGPACRCNCRFSWSSRARAGASTTSPRSTRMASLGC